MIYLQLFLSFLQIGALSFGGGYAAMPLIQEQVVTLHGWLSMEAFTDLVTIAEMTPGPIAVNSATFVGTQIAGPGGAVVATLGCISAFFISGTIDLVRENVCIRMVVFFGAALVLLRKFKMNPILVMVLCGVANMIFCGVMGI